MTFWIVAGLLATVVATLLALALRRPKAGAYAPAAAYDLQVYRDQLREVEKDLARGVVSAEDAERVRAEVSRRILAADTALQDENGLQAAEKGTPGVLAGLIVAGIIGASFALYLELGAPGYGDLGLQRRIALAEEARIGRPDQAAAEAGMPGFSPPPDASPDYVALIEQLRNTVARRPDDLQGHVLLAQNEANLGNFAAAARAQREVIRLKGDTAGATDFADLADMLVLAAGGYVSPEAEAAVQQALARDPRDGTALYYLGLMQAQTGRPDRAFRVWDRLLREGPADAPWIAPIMAQIEEIALRAGVDYQIPEPGGARGPSAADIEAAGEMSPADRVAMIESMVAGLSERLANQGGTLQEWTQLITALGVLERPRDARAVYENAMEVFADDPGAIDRINRAGQQAGVAQ